MLLMQWRELILKVCEWIHLSLGVEKKLLFKRPLKYKGMKPRILPNSSKGAARILSGSEGLVNATAYIPSPP